jgi:hypothetical protein
MQILPDTPMLKGMVYIDISVEVTVKMQKHIKNIKVGYDLTKKSISFDAFGTAACNDVYTYLKLIVEQIIDESKLTEKMEKLNSVPS